MKSIVLSLLLSSCLCCFADDTNIIAASDWSNPVSQRDPKTGHDVAIRGRLLIAESSQPALGWPASKNSARMFIELQNVSFGAGVKFYVDLVRHLNCELVHTDGTPVPLAPSGGWDGGGGRLPYWVVLPANSTIRLFIEDGRTSPLVIHPNAIPSRWWSIPAGDTNIYYLSGTLAISTPTNGTLTVTTPESEAYANLSGNLIFPKAKISVNKQ